MDKDMDMDEVKKFGDYIKEDHSDSDETLSEEVHIIMSHDEKWYFKEREGSAGGIDVKYGIRNPKKIFPVNKYNGVDVYEFHPVSELNVNELATAYYNNRHGSKSIISWLFLESGDSHSIKDAESLMMDMKDSNTTFIGSEKSGVGSYGVPVHTGDHIDFDILKPKIVTYLFGAFKKDSNTL